MKDQPYTLRDARGNLTQVTLRHDRRLKKTSRWERLPNGSLLVRVPFRFPRHRIASLLEQIATQLEKVEALHVHRTDEVLHKRAELVNQKYFDGKIQWNATRWVGNMESSLGSCTRGGVTDGHIRISDKIRNWPDWVIDYVIAHELMHRRYPNHSKAFWDDLKAIYPLAERARGFIQGMSFAIGHTLEDE